MLVVAPHTSNWDFMVGLGARAELKFNPKYIAKKELFFWPLGIILRKLGGYPVERSQSTDFVSEMAMLFDREKEFVLTITPEGTRSYNPNWKSGFFYIAKKANVPVVPVAFDYANKRVVMGAPRKAEGEVEDFIKDLKKWCYQFKGKRQNQGIRAEEVQ